VFTKKFYKKFLGKNWGEIVKKNFWKNFPNLWVCIFIYKCTI
jgi:hypothetical protein